ncbi:MAG TPA: hypothetical protein PLD36_07710 [Bacteroidia bacterium]|nr:hypothetical protein [Bacteroidia bacterium]
MKEKFNTISNWLVYLIVLLTGLFFITRNNLGDDMNLVPGDLGDARFNAYILEHGYKYFAGTTESYWNAPFMVPDQDVISYSDNLLGILPFYAVFRSMHYDVLTSFQFMFLVLVILNYSTCFLFLKWVFKSPFAASLGAFVFAFSISLQSQITHAQTFGRFAGPLAFLFLLMFSQDRKLRNLFLSFICFVWQLYSGIYLGLLFFVPYITVLLAISFKNNKSLPKEVYKNYGLPKILLCFIVPFLSIIPLLGPYLHRTSVVPKPGYSGVLETIPRLDSFLYSEHGSLIWEFLSKEKREIPAFWDHQIFPGALALLSLIFMFYLTKPWKEFKSREKAENQNEPLVYLSLAAFVTFLCFLRIDKLSLYWLIHYLPGFGSMRSMTRIINIELLFFAAAISVVFVTFQKKTKINSGILLVLLLTLLVADNYVYRDFTYHTPKDLANERVRNLVVKMETLPKTSLISYEPDTVPGNPIEYQLDAMLAAQEVGLKCVNGYTATSPREYTDFWNKLDAPSREKWFDTQNYHPNNLFVIH